MSKLIMGYWDTCPHHSTQPQPGYPKILNPHLSESLVKGCNTYHNKKKKWLNMTFLTFVPFTYSHSWLYMIIEIRITQNDSQTSTNITRVDSFSWWLRDASIRNNCFLIGIIGFRLVAISYTFYHFIHLFFIYCIYYFFFIHCNVKLVLAKRW